MHRTSKQNLSNAIPPSKSHRLSKQHEGHPRCTRLVEFEVVLQASIFAHLTFQSFQGRVQSGRKGKSGSLVDTIRHVLRRPA